MQDRIIKWAPFNSVINSNSLINELKKDRNKINKPILSEDQIYLLNEEIFDAYTNHIKITLDYYNNFKIMQLTGFINNIDTVKKYITFSNIHIYFNQILKINTFYEKSN